GQVGVPALALAGDRTAQIVDDDLRTLLRELERMATADPVARSGDDRDLAVQQAHGPLLRSDGSSDRRVRAARRTNPGPHTSFRDAGWGSPPRPRITERGVGWGGIRPGPARSPPRRSPHPGSRRPRWPPSTPPRPRPRRAAGRR